MHSQIGPYRILEEISQTPHSQIFKAQHERKTAIRAIKISSREKIETETRSLEKLSHPNIINIYDSDIDSETPYLILDYAPDTLRKKINRQKTPNLEDTTRTLTNILHGLEHAHEQGILHCDLKPENILLDKTERITDFNFSHNSHEGIQNSNSTNAGTFDYMSPEQRTGKTLTRSTDTYSLGVMFYEMLIGKKPDHYQPKKMAEQGHPTWTDQFFLKATDPNPEQRFQTANEMLEFINQNAEPNQLNEQMKIENEALREVLARQEGRKTRMIRYSIIASAATFTTGLAIGYFVSERLEKQIESITQTFELPQPSEYRGR